MNLKRVAKIVAGGLVAVIVLIGFLFLIGVLGIPGAGLEDNSWGEVGQQRIEVITTVWIDNPNPVGGGDADVEYEIDLQQIRLAEGTGTGLSAPAGKSTHNLTTDLFYNRIPAWWSSHLNNEEVSDLQVNATADTSLGPLSASPSGSYDDTIETDIEGALDSAFSEFEGNYSGTESDLSVGQTAIEPRVDVRNVSTRWGTVTESETEILVEANIHNPNAYPIPTPAFTGDVSFNDITVADWQASEVELLEAQQDAVIAPGETETRTFVVVMDNQNVPPWFASHVDRGEQTDVVITGQLALEISGSEITIPQKGSGVQCSFFMTTSIFVDEQETDMQLESCGTTALETTQEELEAAGAVLDLTETEWWEENSDDDDGVLPGERRDFRPIRTE